jgi:hypothetical protein
MERSKYMRAPDAQLNLVWWLDQIAVAPDAEAVMAIVTQFVGAWPEKKIEEIPLGSRPGRFATPDDVSTYATALARAELAGTNGAPQIHALYIFFTEASARISRLAAAKQRRTEVPRLFIPERDEG